MYFTCRELSNLVAFLAVLVGVAQKHRAISAPAVLTELLAHIVRNHNITQTPHSSKTLDLLLHTHTIIIKRVKYLIRRPSRPLRRGQPVSHVRVGKAAVEPVFCRQITAKQKT